MHNGNNWGGSFEIQAESATDDELSPNLDQDRAAAMARQQLYETQQNWLLGAPDPLGKNKKKKEKYVDLGIFIVKRKVIWWTFLAVVVAFLVIGLPVIVYNSLPKHKIRPPPPDQYTEAVHKALLFFNAQKSGRLPKRNGVAWRGDSGLRDGETLADVKGGLVGGYYDAGDNIKFHFPMAYSMTLLSWSVVEYSQKYQAIGEYDHIRDIIKWGTDYLLRTFNSSATSINKIYIQVGGSKINSTTPDDHYCWQRPEDMDYNRPVQSSTVAPDLAAEVAAALAAASIVFADNLVYSKRLAKASETAYWFARLRNNNREPYSIGNPTIEPFYNSTGWWDEYIWSSVWVYYATGNRTYIDYATDPDLAGNAHAFGDTPNLGVFSWDNKLPGADLLLTRYRVFLNPGYPAEATLEGYQKANNLNLCRNLKQFHVFKWSRGGLIQLNHGRPQPLQYAVTAAFLASLYADYMNATNTPGWYCGPYYYSATTLRNFAASQVNYVLGHNPRNMSYLVGYGHKYPKHVHHRGASIPRDGVKHSCTGGWKWRDAKSPNPNIITGAMVGGPDRFDGFLDVRTNYSYTEPTLAGNAGLVAALISLTASGNAGIDRNTIFTAVPPLYPPSGPPPSPWKP